MKTTITEAELRSEWDRLMPLARRQTAEGKTCRELAELWRCPRGMVEEQVKALLAAGKLRQIGVRPGTGHAAAYELVRGK